MARRLAEHNGEGGSKKGAKYTRPRRPVALAWSAPFETRAAALKAEAAMKKLSRAAKLKIIAGETPSLSPSAASRAAHRPSKAKKK